MSIKGAFPAKAAESAETAETAKTTGADKDNNICPVTLQDLLGLLSMGMGFDTPFQVEDMCFPQLINALTGRVGEKGAKNLLLFHDGAELRDNLLNLCFGDETMMDLAFFNLMIHWEGDEEVGETCHFRVVEIVDYTRKVIDVEDGVRILTVNGNEKYDPEWAGTYLFNCGNESGVFGVVSRLLDVVYTRDQIRRLVPIVKVDRDMVCEFIGHEMPFFKSVMKIMGGDVESTKLIKSHHQKYIDLVYKYLIDSKGGYYDIEPLELIAFNEAINSNEGCTCATCAVES